MKTKTFILTALMLLSGIAALCSRHTEEVKRTITQNFSITGEDHYLQVDNKYGQITIVEWEKPEIDILIEIIGKGENTKIAQAMAKRISVDFRKSGKQVSARTIFGRRVIRCNNCGSTVNYTIRAPRNIYFNLTNQYGNVKLQTAYRDFTASIKYGNMAIGHLHGNHNNISLKYGNIALRSAEKLSIEMDYTKASIDSVGSFLLKCTYSNVKARKINELQLTSKYDKFNISTLGNAAISSGYTTLTINRLDHSICISDLQYGKVRIEDLSPNFKKIDIRAKFSPVYIRMSGGEYNFKADLSTHFGHINTNNIVFNNVQHEGEEAHNKEIKGFVGKESNAEIKISNHYADIILEK